MDNRTHWVPPFTRRDVAGRERAACGEWVTRNQIAPAETEPTCWGCAAYCNSPFGKPSTPARVLATITPDAPWGDPKEAA